MKLPASWRVNIALASDVHLVLYISIFKTCITMIYKVIINYLVLYITPLKTPFLQVARMFFKPTLRIFISPVIVAGVHGLPSTLIVVMPLFLTLHL